MNKTYNRPSYIDPSTITDGGRYYHAAEVDETIAALRQRIAELEGENERLRGALDKAVMIAKAASASSEIPLQRMSCDWIAREIAALER